MLADAIEASSRTLSDPSPAKVQGLVQKMINKIFASGQLDESHLTLKDLHLIAKSFTRVLTGIYHRRVEYSESAEKGKDVKDKKESKDKEKKDAKSRKDSKEAKTTEDPTGTLRLVGEGDKKGKDKENGKSEDTLKRLGI
jgi:membrane-associated HD superfamily phosphohydrolase